MAKKSSRNLVKEINPDKMAHGPVPEKTFAGTTIQGINDMWEIFFDPTMNRTRVCFDTVDNRKDVFPGANAILEGYGFYFSTNRNEWSRKMTWKVYRQSLEMEKELEKAYADYQNSPYCEPEELLFF